MTKWRKLSPSAQVIVDPVSSARGMIRDTRVQGAYRFHWSVIPADEPLPIAAGRTGELARARSITEGALGIYAEDWLELVGAYTEAVSLFRPLCGKLEDVLAGERLFEPVEELGGRIDLVVMLAVVAKH